jgi:hypothetical protein
MFGKLKAKLKEKLSIFSRKTQEVAEEKVTETPIEDKKPSADDLIEETIKEDSTEEKHDEGLVEGVPLEKVEEEVVDRSSDNKEDIVETDETIKDESGEDIKEEEILTTESKEEVTEELLDELKEKETPKQEEAAHEVDEKSEEGLVVDNELSDVGLVTEKYEENKVSEKIKERKVPDEPSDIGLITQSAEEPTKIEEKLATAQDLIQETKNKFEKEDLEKKN